MAKRDENGRFVKGSVGNPKGRPTKEREEKYSEILITTVSFDDWACIVRKAVEQAKRGDYQARKWLTDYLVGAPVQRAELTGRDGGAIPVEIYTQAVERVYNSD